MDKTIYNKEIQLLLNEVEMYSTRNAELTLRNCTKIIQIGMEKQDEALLGFGYYYSGGIYYNLNDGALFYKTISTAIYYLKEAKEWDKVAKSYNFLGIASLNRGNLGIALDYYIKAIKYCKLAKQQTLEAVIHVNIAVLEMQCERYEDAILSLKTARQGYEDYKDHPYYKDFMMSYSCNCARAHLLQGECKEAWENISYIYEHFMDQCSDTDKIPILCVEAMYYQTVGNDEKCVSTIQELHTKIRTSFPIMDMFDELYAYGRVLLERNDKEELWFLIGIIEPLVKSLDLTNMLMRIQNLKIKYYQKNHREEEFVEELKNFYALVDRASLENQVTMNHVIDMRNKLEKVNYENSVLIERSETDPLTNLNNRFRLNDYAEKTFRRIMEEKKSFAVEILDIDNFKGFNDGYGHQLGDECLKKVAAVLKSMEKDYGAFVARYGGDEFILIYTGVTKEEMIGYAETLRQRIIDLQIPHKSSVSYNVVTISQGICFDHPVRGNRTWDFLHAADNMLYRVKARHRNNYCVGDVHENLESIVIGKEWNQET